MPIQAGAVETRGLQLYGEIRLDLLSDLDRLLEDRVELLVGGIERKLLKHEVYLRILHAIELLDGILYLRCTVCTIDLTLEFLLHNSPFFAGLMSADVNAVFILRIEGTWLRKARMSPAPASLLDMLLAHRDDRLHMLIGQTVVHRLSIPAGGDELAHLQNLQLM